jgi:hypothetical protein
VHSRKSWCVYPFTYLPMYFPGFWLVLPFGRKSTGHQKVHSWNLMPGLIWGKNYQEVGSWDLIRTRIICNPIRSYEVRCQDSIRVQFSLTQLVAGLIWEKIYQEVSSWDLIRTRIIRDPIRCRFNPAQDFLPGTLPRFNPSTIFGLDEDFAGFYCRSDSI